MTEFTDVPERVATGRALTAERTGQPPGFTDYRAHVAQALADVQEPAQVFADAVDMLCAHQLAFMDATLTHPYAREVLADVEEHAEHVAAMRRALAAPARAPRAEVIEALADVLHAAEADGHEPEDLRP
ncbi:hypothetical protein [Nocardiopsis tropica]|uniref:Uncharacterized protein n=1 Tax=Nocardiopsis tropica TaxID=109330 RepID=A0ABU7KRT3_9ACTN|nr:hypothetical protein [Nocardiopsis umidischolae]MEE2051787.1 hypothetical protein [Nocardiopsis umidischolae]